MWSYNHTEELYHHGIKGMKWGVRRTPEQLGHKPRGPQYKPRKGDVTLKKGTTFQRISTASNSGYTKGVYTSYKQGDKDLYKGVLGRMRISYLQKMGDDVSLKELTMTAKKDIRLPSKEVRLEEFTKLYDTDRAGVMKLINDHEADRYGRKAMSEFDSSDAKQVSRMYEKFNDALAVGTDSPNGKVIKKYYSTLQKMGYDAIPDENDIRLSTFKAQAPIIMFDTKKSISDITARELSASEVYNAYNRSITKKVVRDILQPGNLGSEKLDPDTIRKAKEYSRQLKRDTFTLNENYTLKNLAEDWGEHRLSSSQISRVSKKMDEGMSHEEAVAETIAYGNVIVDYFLDKLDL